MGKTVTTLIARTPESFSFIYQETIDLLGDVRYFNPETDVPDMQGVDLLYLPGGYPEKHLDTLTAAADTRAAIRRYVHEGGHVIAECGGMMYLCREVVTDERAYPLCGVLPHTITARQCDRRLSLGYRQFTLCGMGMRGHEFHYTRFADPQPPTAVQVYDARGNAVPTTVLFDGRVFASYTHLAPTSVKKLLTILFPDHDTP